MSRTLFTESTKVIDPQPLIYLIFDVSDTINISIPIVIPLFKFLQLRTPNVRQCLVPSTDFMFPCILEKIYKKDMF